MSRSVAEALERYATSRGPREGEVARAAKLHKFFRDILLTCPEIEESYLQGSYPRYTATCGLKDVDVLLVYNREQINDAEKCLDHAEEVLRCIVHHPDVRFTLRYVENISPPSEVVRQGRSIGLKFRDGLPDIDFVPVLPDPESRGYLIYDSKKDAVVKTNPLALGEMIQVVRSKPNYNGGLIGKVIRLLKTFNEEQVLDANDDKLLKSVHLEVMLLNVFDNSRPNDLRVALYRAFAHVSKKVIHPIVVPGSESYSYSTEEAQVIADWYSKAAQVALAALQSERRPNPQQSLNAWKTIFPKLGNINPYLALFGL